MSQSEAGDTIFLVRGLPGSGKSTLCNLLSEKGRYPVFSVDDYFTNPATGEYQFQFEQNHVAYQECAEKAEYAMQKKISKIFIDNCFTLEWEMEPYFNMANRWNYRLMVITVENRHGNSNIHGVTEEQVSKMAAKYKVSL